MDDTFLILKLLLCMKLMGGMTLEGDKSDMIEKTLRVQEQCLSNIRSRKHGHGCVDKFT